LNTVCTEEKFEPIKKIITKLSKSWVWYRESEIRDTEKKLFRILDSKRHQIPDPGSATLTESPFGGGTHEYVADPGYLS
jgi:hypothetical protein